MEFQLLEKTYKVYKTNHVKQSVLYINHPNHPEFFNVHQAF